MRSLNFRIRGSKGRQYSQVHKTLSLNTYSYILFLLAVLWLGLGFKFSLLPLICGCAENNFWTEDGGSNKKLEELHDPYSSPSITSIGGDQIKGDESGETSGTYERERNCLQSFGWKT